MVSLSCIMFGKHCSAQDQIQQILVIMYTWKPKLFLYLWKISLMAHFLKKDLKFLFYSCLRVCLPVWVYVHHVHVGTCAEEDIGSPWNLSYRQLWTIRYGCWGPNLCKNSNYLPATPFQRPPWPSLQQDAPAKWCTSFLGLSRWTFWHTPSGCSGFAPMYKREWALILSMLCCILTGV